MSRYTLAQWVFRPWVFSSYTLGGGDAPDFMHGHLDVWPVLEGDLRIGPYVTGDINCGLYLGETTGDIGTRLYVTGDMRVDHYLCGKIEVNK